MTDDDEQLHHFVPRNVVSFMADLLAQDFQEQAAQMVNGAPPTFRTADPLGSGPERTEIGGGKIWDLFTGVQGRSRPAGRRYLAPYR